MEHQRLKKAALLRLEEVKSLLQSKFQVPFPILVISISNLETVLDIRNDPGPSNQPRKVDCHPSFSVLSSRSWELDSPFVSINLYHDD
jgi:hypothetical protein